MGLKLGQDLPVAVMISKSLIAKLSTFESAFSTQSMQILSPFLEQSELALSYKRCTNRQF